MESEPYARFKHDQLILRDYLAVDRTVLANERTLLAYVRTGIAFAAGGAALIDLFDVVSLKVLGGVLILLAVGMFVVGAQRYLRMKQRLARLVDKAPKEDKT